jgi:hypothetical protein
MCALAISIPLIRGTKSGTLIEASAENDRSPAPVMTMLTSILARPSRSVPLAFTVYTPVAHSRSTLPPN